VHATCIDQKLLTVATDSSTEMVGYTFVVIKSGGPSKSSSQLSSRLLMIHEAPNYIGSLS
jgi:hypothetical protein